MMSRSKELCLEKKDELNLNDLKVEAARNQFRAAFTSIPRVILPDARRRSFGFIATAICFQRHSTGRASFPAMSLSSFLSRL
jgi:hypothetical protein